MSHTRRLLNQIPQVILTDPALNQAISHLPSNYNFEIHKCIWKIRSLKPKCIALQLPEGLLRWACPLADIFTQYSDMETEVIIMGDVTYGACCIDDYTAASLGAEFLIHYGHSCLVPIDVTRIPTHYVFVDIAFDPEHLIECLHKNFPSQTVVLMGTVQFLSTINLVASRMEGSSVKIFIPQEKPLSRGELLGCTAPSGIAKAFGLDAIVYVADGRFHLEALMIANPSLAAFQYDPYSKVLTRESYDHAKMLLLRENAISKSRLSIMNNEIVGLIIGTLGRQSSPSTISFCEEKLLQAKIAFVKICISEISPGKLALFPPVGCWIQTSCPRLSIDWGYSYGKPLLSPYEGAVLLKESEWDSSVYPMNFYSKSSASPWTPYWKGLPIGA
jgi:2-(3-amino-3-carboxypropyl)histidine synthase